MLAAQTLTATAAAAMAATIALTTQVAEAGTVSLFEHTEHDGREFRFDIWNSEQCYNVHDCFNDRASSAKWARLTPDYNVFFFAESNCQGEYRAWPVFAPHQPTNFVLDGFNDQVSSVLVAMGPNDIYNGIYSACSKREVFAGSNGSDSGPTIESGIVKSTLAPTALVAEGH